MGKPRKRKGTRSASFAQEGGRKAGDGSVRRWRWRPSAIQTAALLVCLVLVNYAILARWRFFSTESSTFYRVAGEVKVLTLSSPHEKFAKECQEGAVPVVLRNSVTELWKAKNWSPNYLGEKLERISGIYENDNRWFGPYFDTSKPLANISTRTNPYRTNLELHSEDFMSTIQNTTEGQFLYFTGDIDRLGEWAFDEIQPTRELLMLNPRRSSINVWIGQPHVIAHCHYDGYHNFYAQLYGTKKFTLFRPTNWPGLYPYPFLHPSHAQAQVNVSDASDARGFPLVSKVEAVEVVLQPGDLLYMPPLWFHHVESMSVSISVNVWTDSKQTGLMEKVYSLALPTDSHVWPSPHTKAIATSLLLFSVMEGVCHARKCLIAAEDRFSVLPPDSSIEKDKRLYFVHRLWNARYRSLMERRQLPDSFSASSESGKHGILCEATDVVEAELLLQEVLSMLAKTDFKEYVGRVSRLIKDLPSDTWELWVGNYVEFVVAQAVPVQYVGLFLRHFESCVQLVLKEK